MTHCTNSTRIPPTSILAANIFILLAASNLVCSQHFGWNLLDGSLPFGWLTTILLAHRNLNASEPFGLLTYIWVTHIYLASSKIFYHICLAGSQQFEKLTVSLLDDSAAIWLAHRQLAVPNPFLDFYNDEIDCPTPKR